MRRALIIAALLWPALALAEASGQDSGEAKVIDAETIEVDGARFRLHGIDAPEPDQTCRHGATIVPCGRIAVTALMDLTAGARVSCVPIAGASDPGAATCRAEGYDLSEGMVYTGWALADRAASIRYVELEQGAAAARRGLWRTEFVMPWAWRAGQRLPDIA